MFIATLMLHMVVLETFRASIYLTITFPIDASVVFVKVLNIMSMDKEIVYAKHENVEFAHQDMVQSHIQYMDTSVAYVLLTHLVLEVKYASLVLRVLILITQRDKAVV